jgi:hypothetical protein
VLLLHDLGQGGGEDAAYFAHESWHVFDLGLLPGPEWAGAWERASAGGTRGPELGMRTVGWPKMDHVDRDPDAFGATVRALRERLGLGARPAVLLACSWSDRAQLRDAVARVDPAAFDLVVKYPESGPPPPGSPWEARLSEAFAELGRARELALSLPTVKVADDDTDIMTLLAAVDVVLSNGSNVLYEGILAGVPGVSIREWLHPAGRDGHATAMPRLQLPGVVAGDLVSLPAMLRIVRDPVWAPLVQDGAAALVDPATRGSAAALAADAIDDALSACDARSPEERARIAAAALVAREDDEQREQLRRVHEALAQSDEREARARDQLKVYEAQIAELRAALGAG